MSESGISANRLELLQIADAVARDKSIDKNIVISAMEDAIQKAAKTRYGSENEIRAEIDPKTGQTNLARLLEVVEVVENKATEIDLKQARKKNKEAEIGDFISEELPPIEFGRIAAQSAKQVIFQKVRDAERVLKPAVNYLIKIKCKKIILGCTELPIAIFAYKSFKKIRESKIFIDPNLLLAQVSLKKYRK